MTSFWEDFKHRSAYLGAALSWFSSFLCDRTQTVVINSQRSKTSLVTSGVPHGSVLGPILFLLYSYNIGLIAEKNIKLSLIRRLLLAICPLNCHDAAVTCLRVVLCIRDINNWMASNWLKLNSDKTQFIMLGLRQQLAWTVVVFVLVAWIYLSRRSKLPWRNTWRCASYGATYKGVARRCFYQLRQIHAIRKSPTVETKVTWHRFVNSRLDYCISVLQGVGAVHLQKLQVIKNGAARIVARKRKFDPITSTIRY